MNKIIDFRLKFLSRNDIKSRSLFTSINICDVDDFMTYKKFFLHSFFFISNEFTSTETVTISKKREKEVNARK